MIHRTIFVVSPVGGRRQPTLILDVPCKIRSEQGRLIFISRLGDQGYVDPVIGGGFVIRIVLQPLGKLHAVNLRKGRVAQHPAGFQMGDFDM